MCLIPVYLKERGFVACGKCLECLQKRSVEWSFRIMLESKQHTDNCFITLTYNDANLPAGASLKRMDLQKFIKRLRKFVSPVKIRFFYCGEYGSGQGNRGYNPHYHIIVFGWKPNDLWFWCYDNKKTKLFRSPSIEKLWTFGFSSVGDLTIDSAKYCAKYMQKAIADSYAERSPSFIGMSNRPGIAYCSINAKMLETGKIYYNGKYIKLPRYFLKVLEKYVPYRVAEYKNKNKFSLTTYNDYYNFLDNLILRNKKFLKNFTKSEIYKQNKKTFRNVVADYEERLKSLKTDEELRFYFDERLKSLKNEYIKNYSVEFFKNCLTAQPLSAIIFNAYDTVRKSP